MCTIGPDSEARAGEGEARSWKPMPIPLRLPPLVALSEQGYSGTVASPEAERKEKKKAGEEERESTADAGSLPGAC